jgi:hypothetical protein
VLPAREFGIDGGAARHGLQLLDEVSRPRDGHVGVVVAVRDEERWRVSRNTA